MKKTLRSFALLFLTFGCIFQNPSSTKIPSDLELEYSYGACKAEWGRTNIIINADGSGVYESGRGSYDNGKFGQTEFKRSIRIDKEKLLKLLNEIESSGYYSLNDYYSNPEIRDGSCRFISVTANNRTKSVSVSNTQAPSMFSKVADLIYAVAENTT